MRKERTIVGSRQLSRMLGLRQTTVARMARNGELPAIRLGRVYRFDLDRVREALDAKTTIQKMPAAIASPALPEVEGSSGQVRVLLAVLAELREVRRALARRRAA